MADGPAFKIRTAATDASPYAGASCATAQRPNVYGWMLRHHLTSRAFKLGRVRIRFTVQIWRPWRPTETPQESA